MSGIKITKRNDVYYVEGWLDELSDLQPLLKTTDAPLRLNFRGVTSINSIGLGGLIKFSEALRDRPVEFLELHPVIVEAVNIAPLTVGGQKKLSRIKSVFVPLNCTGRHPISLPIQIKDLDIKGKVIELPAIHCERCFAPLHLDELGDPEDFFFFLVAN